MVLWAEILTIILLVFERNDVFIKSFWFLLTFIGLSGVILQGVYLDLNLLTHGQEVSSFIFMGQRNLFSIQYLKTLQPHLILYLTARSPAPPVNALKINKLREYLHKVSEVFL